MSGIWNEVRRQIGDLGSKTDGEQLLKGRTFIILLSFRLLLVIHSFMWISTISAPICLSFGIKCIIYSMYANVFLEKPQLKPFFKYKIKAKQEVDFSLGFKVFIL